MINSRLDIKLIDFGFSIYSTSDKLSLFCGTPNYMSPEVILRNKYCGKANDIWSFAVISFKLISGKYPFEGENTSSLNKKILKLDYEFSPFFGLKEKMFFDSCFTLCPLKRPSAEELINFDFFK